MGAIADSLSISIHASIYLFVYLLTIFGAVQRHFPPDLRYHGERCCVTPGGIQEEGELAGKRKKWTIISNKAMVEWQEM